MSENTLERSSGESSLLVAFFLHGTLTVGFGFVAAANPIGTMPVLSVAIKKDCGTRWPMTIGFRCPCLIVQEPLCIICFRSVMAEDVITRKMIKTLQHGCSHAMALHRPSAS